jgi:hypothetical protein
MWRVLSIVVVSCGVVVLPAPTVAAQETDVETRSPLRPHVGRHRLGLEITERTRSSPSDHG